MHAQADKRCVETIILMDISIIFSFSHNNFCSITVSFAHSKGEVHQFDDKLQNELIYLDS